MAKTINLDQFHTGLKQVTEKLTEKDITFKSELEKQSGTIESLKIRTHAGEELEYGTFELEVDSPLMVDKIIPFTKSINGNIVSNNGKIQLKQGRTYKFDCVFSIVGDDMQGIYIGAVDGDGVVLAQNSIVPSSFTGHMIASNEISFTYMAEKNTSIELKPITLHMANPKARAIATRCTVHEIGRTYVHDPVKEIDELSGIQDTPVGNIISHIGLTAPNHYLVCDGKEYNIVDYPKLAEHIFNEFGTYNYFGGDGTTTFAVPDMRGEFVRGYDGEAIRDPQGNTRGIGKHQDATIQNNIITNMNGTSSLLQFSGKDKAWHDVAYCDKKSDSKNFASTYTKLEFYNAINSKDVTSQYRARPTNVNVLYCIKCEPTYYMEYHPKYASFKTDILFDGIASDIGEYELLADIRDYDFVVIESDQFSTCVSKEGYNVVRVISYNLSNLFKTYTSFKINENKLIIIQKEIGTNTASEKINKIIGFKGGNTIT